MVTVMADKYIMTSIPMTYRLEFYVRKSSLFSPFITFLYVNRASHSPSLCPYLVYVDARICALLAGFVSLQYAPMFSSIS